MHPILASRGAPLYVLAWAPLALLLAAYLAVSGTLAGPAAVALALPLGLFYGFVGLGSYYLCRVLPLSPATAAKAVGTQLVAAALSASVWVLVGSGWARLLETVALRFALPIGIAPTAYRRVVPVLFLAGILLFLLAAALHYVILALQASRDAERRALEAELASREAELRALRAQLHPHFLFNSLNSINALIGSDPAAARRVCLQLGELLRRNLTLAARERIALGEELALAESLLAVEQARFGARLRLELVADEAARACAVPPLVLQPLVENAVTHGIAPLVEGGVVRIEAHRREGQIEIVVENPRDPMAPPRRGAGVGITNVRRRLETLFGREGTVEVSRGAASFRVAVRLPASRAAGTG
jgi:two-component system sensor histidine kinase AlgZ